jgi:hypothetical protein
VKTKGKFPLSAVGIGLGGVLPVDSTLMMWAGAHFFAWLESRYHSKPGTTGHSLWVESQEPIAAGIVAGAAILGIGDQLISVFILGH